MAGSTPVARRLTTRRDASWVTKTDVTRYLRCPYAFWLLDTGRVRLEDVIPAEQQSRIAAGVAFHQDYEAASAPAEPAESFESLLAGNDDIVVLPLVRRDDLRIRGVPDGVRPSGGALVPIEVKNHRLVTAIDRVELAFYWLLLEPFRTSATEPCGVLVVPDGTGGTAERPVPLDESAFAAVSDAIAGVRRARVEGVLPRFCRCSICSGAGSALVLDDLRARGDLSLVAGIGRTYLRHLDSLGVTDLAALRARRPAELAAALRDRKAYVSVASVEQWQHHAAAWESNDVVVFGDGFPLPRRWISFDLEYAPETGDIWLIGAAVVSGRRTRIHQWWADTAGERRDALAQVVRLLEAASDLPVVTWGGTCADLPVLAGAGRHARMAARLVVSRHVDLYRWVQSAVRLPVPTLSLKDVSAYFGDAATSDVASGRAALGRYHAYRTEPNRRRRASLRGELLGYNADDLRRLVVAANGLRGHASGPPRSREPQIRRATADQSL